VVPVMLASTIALLMGTVVSPARAAPNFSFDWTQNSYYQNGVLMLPNTPYGRCNVTYTPDSAMWFLNVVGHTAGGADRWLLQNHPLLPMSVIGTAPVTSQGFVDFGTPTNTAVGMVTVWYTLENAPAPTMPAIVGTYPETVPMGADILNSGVPSGVAALGPAPNVNWKVSYATPTVAVHPNMPNVTQRNDSCGPGPAANSLSWLMTANGYPASQTTGQIQDELAGNMGNNQSGNWDDNEMTGKLTYIKNHSLPIEVHYTGGVKAPTAGNYTDPNNQGAARNDGAITCNRLVQQMQKGQDVELMTNTHRVVLEGIVAWNGVCQILYRDDPVPEQHLDHRGGTECHQRSPRLDRLRWNEHQHRERG
jgi:hypothetical protein